jgi:hypothetical protein
MENQIYLSETDMGNNVASRLHHVGTRQPKTNKAKINKQHPTIWSKH